MLTMLLMKVMVQSLLQSTGYLCYWVESFTDFILIFHTMFNILYHIIEQNQNNIHAVTTVAYVFKVTLNKFAAQEPILREKKNNKYEIVHLLNITNMRILHLFNEGDLNESYIFLLFFFLQQSCELKGQLKMTVA